jgi:hypothetical protein
MDSQWKAPYACAILVVAGARSATHGIRSLKLRGAGGGLEGGVARTDAALARGAKALALGIVLALASSCGEDTQLIVNYAPQFAALTPHTISVFGVFKDGRMDTEAWYGVAPRVSSLLGRISCNTPFDTDLVGQHAALTSAVDEYTRNYGVTDPLLNEFAASANGELILVLYIAGRPPSLIRKGPATEAPLPMSRGSGFRADPDSPVGSRPVEVSASLYSVPLHRSVASIAERYAGKNVDQAIARFEDKLKEALPIATCEGWDFDTHPVDDSKVHALPEP